MNADTRSLEALWAERLVVQKHRDALTFWKLAWVCGLLVVGALGVYLGLESAVLLLLAPVVALVFDLFTLRAVLSLRRMDAHVATRYSALPSGPWEPWAGTRRDPFSRASLPVSSAVVLAAATGLLHLTSAVPVLVVVWASVNLLLILVAHGWSLVRLAGLDRLIDERRRKLAEVAAAAVNQGAGATGELPSR